MHSNDKPFYSGTSGLVLDIPKSLYPPAFKDKSRLTYYASLFNSVEINSSFYKMPQAATVSRWAGSVPQNFQFTFKLLKAISHAKGLEFSCKEVELFMQTINNIGNKKGCLLVQFPPSLKIEKLQQVADLLKCLAETDNAAEWKVAVEFRNKSWYQNEAYDLLRQYKATMVMHDLPGRETPMDESRSVFRYLRFHGPGGRYRGSYEDDFLSRYARYIGSWIKEKQPVYFYFNNTMGDAVKNLKTLNELLKNAMN